MNEWHTIHDFSHGWGIKEHIPNNEIVIEDHSNEEIRWKVIRHKVQERVIWDEDCYRLLGFSVFSKDFNPEECYAAIKPILDEECRVFLANYKPPTYDKITIPKINRQYPSVDIAQRLCHNVLHEKALNS